jgi:hypothetical protein
VHAVSLSLVLGYYGMLEMLILPLTEVRIGEMPTLGDYSLTGTECDIIHESGRYHHM